MKKTTISRMLSILASVSILATSTTSIVQATTNKPALPEPKKSPAPAHSRDSIDIKPNLSSLINDMFYQNFLLNQAFLAFLSSYIYPNQRFWHKPPHKQPSHSSQASSSQASSSQESSSQESSSQESSSQESSSQESSSQESSSQDNNPIDKSTPLRINNNTTWAGKESDPFYLQHPFYKYYKTTKDGIVIKSSHKVNPSNIELAEKIMNVVLSKSGTGLAETMAANHFAMAIYGEGETVWSVPEHAYLNGRLTVRGTIPNGYGAIPSNPVSSTKYSNYNTLVHEIGHAVHLLGMDLLDDQSLANELKANWDNVEKKNLFPNTYARTNIKEYFAVCTSIWFNVEYETSDGSWSGQAGPVNTREELKRYDPSMYALLAKIYPTNGTLSIPNHNPPANRFTP